MAGQNDLLVELLRQQSKLLEEIRDALNELVELQGEPSEEPNHVPSSNGAPSGKNALSDLQDLIKAGKEAGLLVEKKKDS